MKTTMKKLLLVSSATVVILTGSSAYAGDLSFPTLKAPYATTYSWTGCYVGAHGGAGGLNDSWTGEQGIGGLVGGQVGCNYQMGMLVLGIEGEGFWSGMKGTYSQSEAIPVTTAYSETFTATNTWDADIAARFGLAIDRALIYGKAGVVWGGFNFVGNYQSCCALAYTYNGGTNTLTGLLIGLGLEYGITANWTAKFEYDYLGFPAKSINIGAPFAVAETYGGSAQVVKVGFNYKFNLAPPPPAP